MVIKDFNLDLIVLVKIYLIYIIKKLDLLLDEIISNQFNDISFVSYDNNYL